MSYDSLYFVSSQLIWFYCFLCEDAYTLNNLGSLHASFNNSRTPAPTIIKVRKAAKIRNQYTQEPHLTQDTTWDPLIEEMGVYMAIIEFWPIRAKYGSQDEWK